MNVGPTCVCSIRRCVRSNRILIYVCSMSLSKVRESRPGLASSRGDHSAGICKYAAGFRSARNRWGEDYWRSSERKAGNLPSSIIHLRMSLFVLRLWAQQNVLGNSVLAVGRLSIWRHRLKLKNPGDETAARYRDRNGVDRQKKGRRRAEHVVLISLHFHRHYYCHDDRHGQRVAAQQFASPAYLQPAPHHHQTVRGRQI